METSLKIGFAQIFSCCPKNLSCPNFGGAAAPLAPPARTPMLLTQEFENGKKNTVNQQDGKKTDQADWHLLDHLSYLNKSKYLQPF